MTAHENRVALVAGGGGFIGGHLAAELLRRGYGEVRCVDRKPFEGWYQFHEDARNGVDDLAELGACRRWADGVTDVFNLAADMGGMGFIENNKALCMLSVRINTHLLMAAHELSVDRFFFSSSACVYNGSKQTRPDVTALREDDAYPADAEDGYGWEKLFSERMCRHFREDFGLHARVARYHNVYGPFGTWTGGREKAPAALCRKVIEAKRSGDHTVEIWGDGEQTRSFMYVDDCVRGTLLFHDGHCTEPLNLGSSELVSINQLADVIAGIAGITIEKRHDLGAPKGVRGRNSDNTRILDEYGWEPSTRLVDGLEKTYAWIWDQIASGASEAALPSGVVQHELDFAA